MNTTTLRGVFPEPKPVPRRNFMRENIKQLKQMQGLVDREPSLSQTQISSKINPKYRHVPSRVYSNLNRTRGFNFETRKPFPLTLRGSAPERPTDKKIVHRGVQTDRPEDISKLFEKPNLSPKAVKKSTPSPPPQTRPGQGDSLARNLQKLAIDEKHDYVKSNIKNIRYNKLKPDQLDSSGVLPTKDSQKSAVLKKAGKCDGDSEDKANLALLPDDERKEYLRVARENYAGLIKELNTMPIRNDTLRKRNRKIQIEEELKRLDEVIRIFQKPKVFVKADA